MLNSFIFYVTRYLRTYLVQMYTESLNYITVLYFFSIQIILSVVNSMRFSNKPIFWFNIIYLLGQSISSFYSFVSLKQAILVKGVITNDIVGRPTEIRFFYKQAESENFVVYFPNFNLTMRDPGNYGELAMITLPKYVQARFVILGEHYRPTDSKF